MSSVSSPHNSQTQDLSVWKPFVATQKTAILDYFDHLFQGSTLSAQQKQSQQDFASEFAMKIFSVVYENFLAVNRRHLLASSEAFQINASVNLPTVPAGKSPYNMQFLFTAVAETFRYSHLPKDLSGKYWINVRYQLRDAT